MIFFSGIMDRSIPHIRNIFSSSSRKKSNSDTQDLCQFERSPRSRRKSNKEFDHELKHSGSAKKAFDFGKENHKSGDDHRKSSNKNGNYNTYTSKTLTEKDMKHLERHLSMKKTIRKQISRNLAQAFLDNPDIFEPIDDKASDHEKDFSQVFGFNCQNLLCCSQLFPSDNLSPQPHGTSSNNFCFWCHFCLAAHISYSHVELCFLWVPRQMDGTFVMILI